jgi:chemotaxis-related protein WspB
MLFLLFEVGDARYALEARLVAEVLPLVAITPIPEAPAAVAGIFNYHGAPVPVIDVSCLTFGRPAPHRLSTRIVLVHYPGAQGESHLLGLVAEKATRTIRRDASEFVHSGVTPAGAPYAGPVAPDGGRLLQRIDPHTLLPAAIRDLLFRTVKMA